MKTKTKNYSWKNYTEYLKDNPKGLWFKMKLYGCGEQFAFHNILVK